MGMDMIVYAGSSRPSDIGANIKAGGTKYLPQNPDAMSDNMNMVAKLLISQLLNFFSAGLSQRMHPSSFSIWIYSIRHGAQICFILVPPVTG